MQFSQKLIALAVLALVSAAIFATSAGGDPGNGNGAFITTLPTTCLTFGDIVECVTIRGEQNSHIDGAGKFHFAYNEYRATSFTAPGITQSDEQRFHIEDVFDPDGQTPREYHISDRGNFVYTDAAGVVHQCTFTSAFHLANGQVQYDRLTQDCT